jgi:hypothetical protein
MLSDEKFMIVRFLSSTVSQAPAGAQLAGWLRDLANVGENAKNTYTPLPDRLVEEYRRNCDVQDRLPERRCPRMALT